MKYFKNDVFIRLFAFNTKIPIMAMLASKDFTAVKHLHVRFDLMITGSRV